MTHELPPLGYKFDALEPHIDAKTMEIHHDKHHAGYVKKLNAALEGHEKLQEKSAEELIKDIKNIPEDIRKAIQNNGGGHVNHTLFWSILKKDSKPANEIKEAIHAKFGSGPEFLEKFKEAAMTQFGSGWAWLVVNENKELEIVKTANQDNPLTDGKTPILGIDVWEHAYYLSYQNKRDEYVDNFFKVVNWEKVNELYLKAKG